MSQLPIEMNMDTTLLSSKKVNECMHRIESQDEQLRHLRSRVELHASQLLKSSGAERELAYQLYKHAMRRLLKYLETNFIDQA